MHTLTARARRVTVSMLTLAALASGLVAIDAAVHAAPAAAASSVGGYITRTEVMERAKYWVDRGVVYGTKFDSAGHVVSSRTATDSSGKAYRTDCSGFAAMAWHLSDSPSTSNFMGSDSRWTAVSNGVNGLRPGDVMVKTGHLEIFAGWKSYADHTQGAWVYSLNGPIDQDWAKRPNKNSHGQLGRGGSHGGWGSAVPAARSGGGSARGRAPGP